MSCKIPDCDRAIKVKQMCKMHYQREYRAKNPAKPSEVLCGFQPCGRPVYGRYSDLCYPHYKQQRASATLTPIRLSRCATAQEAIAHYTPASLDDNQCWLWSGARSKSGYGNVNPKYGDQYAHRLAWRVANGMQPIPEGLVVRHKCDNPPCVNPNHLELGTHTDNARDRTLRNRGARGESVAGAVLTEQDVADIRKLRWSDGLTCAEIAKRYGVNKGTVSYATNGTTWTHVTDPEP